MKRRALGFLALACLSSALAAACGSSERDSLTSKTSNDAGAGAFAPSNGDTGPTDFCAAEITRAQRALVDIIVIIDGSGSMLEETHQVQQNLNAFAESIGKSGLDYQVLMIADKRYKLPFQIGPFTEAGICVPPPLGGPNCTDNAPKYRQVAQAPDSRSSLQLILSSYESWKQHLRLPAYKVFIEITDDDSQLSSQAFDQALLAKQPASMFGTSVNRRYVFDSICGWQDGSPPLGGQKCSTADSPGHQYQALSQLTNGTIESVCKTTYDSVFNNLAKGLTTMLGCVFTLPTPTSGTLDPTAVIVNYTSGGATSSTALVQVTDVSKCGTVGEGWYYDDPANPKQITFCPALCGTAGSDTAGRLEIAVGCKGAPPR